MRKVINLIIVFSTVMFTITSCRTYRFMDKYFFSCDGKAEVSDFKKNNYHEIDCVLFLETINHSKKVVAKFIPSKEVVLTDNFGKTYKLYFSDDNRCFKIKGDYYQLSKKESKKLTTLFEYNTLKSS